MHFDYPLDWYLGHFSRLKARNLNAKAPSLLGEKSARYCSLEPDRIRLVHDLLPDAKIILMTRDPVARHWAQAKRYFSKRRFNKLEGGVLAIPREDLFAFFERMRPLGEFSSMIENWKAIYPEQLLVLSQERALDDPRATFDAVLEHIGASKDYDPAEIALLTRQKNVGPKIEMPDDVRAFLEAALADERQYLRDFFSGAPAIRPA